MPARSCTVTASVAGLSVRDDGAGRGTTAPGHGLRGIAERVAAAGLDLAVRDAHPHGTIVEVMVPTVLRAAGSVG